METKTWATMPPNIIERIIGHAVKRNSYYSYNSNEWPMRVRNYGRVCTTWMTAVLESRSIFESNENHFIRIGEPNTSELVRDGFLGVVRGVCLSKNANDSHLELAWSNFNSILIEEYKLDLPQKLSLQAFECLIDMIKTSKKASIFKIEVNLASQREAQRLWVLMNTVTNCNDLQKEIYIELKSKCKIDWNFTAAS